MLFHKLRFLDYVMTAFRESVVAENLSIASKIFKCAAHY